MPERQNFFVRASSGDLGAKPQREYSRFVAKAPHAAATASLLGLVTGLGREESVASQAWPTTDDPIRNAMNVKALGHFSGAQLTAICEIPDYAWYSHRDDGTPIDADHKYAVVFVLDQGRDTMEGASDDDWISGAQSMRAYLRAAMISISIAAQIRRSGHEARGYSMRSDELLHLPLLLKAGIGELSRIGEVVLNPFAGPRFKSGVVTTNLPLAVDQPIDFGLQEFCETCTKCARECPVSAIRSGAKTMFNGYEMWKPDVHRCTSYRLTNTRGSACGRCMKTCPYNLEGILAERPFQWLARKFPASGKWIARLDDRVGNGKINPRKKWWLDVELIDGVPVSPLHGANERGLQMDKHARADSDFAIFPPRESPSAEETGPFRADRKSGVRASRQAETPAEARARTRNGRE